MNSVPGSHDIEGLRLELRDRYTIEAMIGSGGMADVYRALDLKHGRQVAVKVLRREIGDRMGADRFAREIEIAARLQHPNILPVYDSGEAAGTLYYTMPFVAGGSLRALLSERRQLPLDEALEIIREVADALTFAHRCRVVHRDIKPENILFLADHAVVADFGIAKAIESINRQGITLEGFGLGTPEYVSPEQAFGESTIDERSDVYSLGCVAWEMLTGAPPHTGTSVVAVLHRKTTQSLPSLGNLGLQGLDEVLGRALALEAAQRFPSAVAFAGALRESSAGRGAPDATAVQAPKGTSIVVLPFANVSGSTDDDYLSDGITDELTYALARVPDLRVVARTSAFMFRDHSGDVRTIGQQLGVQHLLEGTLRRAGSRLRITVRLIDASTGYEVWAQRYDREFTDVFAVQDDITHAIVHALRIELLQEPAPRGPASTQNLRAYQRFLEARFLWNRRTETGMQKSLIALREAIDLDPAFPAAHAALAAAYVTLAVYGQLAPDDAMPRARDAAERALRLDPMEPDALAARGCVRGMYEGRWADAEADFQQAVGSGPQAPTAYQAYAMNLLVPLKRFEEARHQLERAREFDPLSPVVASSWALIHYFEGDCQRAIAEQEALLARDPEFGMAHFFIGQASIAAGRPEEAMDQLRLATMLVGETPEIVATLGVACAAAGEEAAARTVVTELERRAATSYVSPVLLAQIHTALGDGEAALDALDRARAVHATDLAWIGVRPTFDPLRLHPRFHDLVNRIGLV
jgi:serine/threonine protein kinase/tetratricopeptide (TPR) repeat protein